MASSDHNIIVVGTQSGLLRSLDLGESWARMTFTGDVEHQPLTESFGAVAIDPQNPDIVYAGAPYSLWKTVNGGIDWHRMNKGLPEDCDIANIIINPKVPSQIYVTACSTIYTSSNAAALFRPLHTFDISDKWINVLNVNLYNRSVIYAGTTRGLWRTSDGGQTWSCVTSPDAVISDVLIDPRDLTETVVAASYNGVLLSSDAFVHYVRSTQGLEGVTSTVKQE